MDDISVSNRNPLLTNGKCFHFFYKQRHNASFVKESLVFPQKAFQCVTVGKEEVTEQMGSIWLFSTWLTVLVRYLNSTVLMLLTVVSLVFLYYLIHIYQFCQVDHHISDT